jgi:hypothetical protein
MPWRYLHSMNRVHNVQREVLTQNSALSTKTAGDASTSITPLFIRPYRFVTIFTPTSSLAYTFGMDLGSVTRSLAHLDQNSA